VISRLVRWIGLFLLTVNVLYFLNFHSVHEVCPYGGLETLYKFSIYSTSFLMLLVVVLITLFFRRSFCGLLCPLGALQELFAKLGKSKYLVPQKIDRSIRMLKYGILFVTLIGALSTKSYWWVNYDPYFALFTRKFFTAGTLVLSISFIGSVLSDRFFCKYLCPLGAFIAIIGYFSPSRVVRDDSVCIHCNLCSKVCPVNIPVAVQLQIKSLECLSCNECVNICPKEGAIAIKSGKITIQPILVWVLVFLFFLGGAIIVSRLAL